MKPEEKKPEIVFRIISDDGESIGSYSRSYHYEYDFSSVHQARSANCHGTFKDKTKYKIAKYRVTYELIEDDVDPPNEEEIKAAKKEQDLEDKMDKLGIEGVDRIWFAIVNKIINEVEKHELTTK